MMTDITLTGLTGERLRVEGSVIDALGAGMRGKLVLPQSAEYESARQIHNMIHDRRPGLIARVAGVADVTRVVQFAREYGLLTSIKGGGHGVAGFATNDGGLMIDLSAMQAIHVDPRRRIARAQGGATWGTFFHEDAGVRSCDHGWRESADGNRRAHTGRGARISDAELRSLRGQSAFSRRRDGRRAAPHGERTGES